MRLLSLFCVGAFCLLVSCTTETRLESVREVPIKSAALTGFETGLMWAQITYIMYGARTSAERRERMGQYYYVTWSDANPDLPAKLVFDYQQSNTGSKVYTKTIELPAGRSGGEEKNVFTIIGDEYFDKGPVLTWKTRLFIDDRLVSTRKSYLWGDDDTTSGKFSVPEAFAKVPPLKGEVAGSTESPVSDERGARQAPDRQKSNPSLWRKDRQKSRNFPGTMSGAAVFPNSP